MIAGSPLRRTYNASNFEDQAITYHCLGALFSCTLLACYTDACQLDYNQDHTGDPAWGSKYFCYFLI
jgi:hypothetical protein